MASPPVLKEDVWQGGKPAGNIDPSIPGRWYVRFRMIGAYRAFWFDTEPGSKEKARADAEAWQLKTSDDNNLTRNKWMIQGDVLFVELGDGAIMRTDVEALQLVEAYTWGVKREKQNRYAKTTVYATGATKYFHSLYTGFEMVDHENRDGLDNTRANLRKADHKLNMRNRRKTRRNTSGETGVAPAITKSGGVNWTASWTEDDGRRVGRGWAVAKYGEAEAHRLATEARREACVRLGITNE